jgi:phytoene/squalene synthetase
MEVDMERALVTARDPAALATRAASMQTYYTILLLADEARALNAYRAYAYFRWLDDWLDEGARSRSDQMSFVRRQADLVRSCNNGHPRADVCSEEQMLVELVRSDPAPGSGLAIYVHQMLAVMAIDAERRGRWISQAELDTYQLSLATAVTEAMHYFIGRGGASPHTGARYLAVTAAHITHMLRDTCEDVQAGYFNIPGEFLHQHNISPDEIHAAAYRAWVQNRVELARRYFKAGREYMAQVESPRCRLAGYAYIARFEAVLDVIERDDYVLRPEYRERNSLTMGLRIARSVVRSAVDARMPRSAPQALAAP